MSKAKTAVGARAKKSTVAATAADSLEVAVPLHVVGRALELQDVRDQIRALEKRKEELSAALTQAMGDAKYGTHRGKRVIQAVHGVSVWTDRRLLKEAYPEAYEATDRRTPWTSFKPL